MDAAKLRKRRSEITTWVESVSARAAMFRRVRASRVLNAGQDRARSALGSLLLPSPH
jgi:hypothetical protein